MNIRKLCSKLRDYLDVQNALKAKPSVQHYVLIDLTLLPYSCAFTMQVARCTRFTEGWRQLVFKVFTGRNSETVKTVWDKIQQTQQQGLQIRKMISYHKQKSDQTYCKNQTYRLTVKSVILSMMTGKKQYHE